MRTIEQIENKEFVISIRKKQIRDAQKEIENLKDHYSINNRPGNYPLIDNEIESIEKRINLLNKSLKRNRAQLNNFYQIYFSTIN